MLARQERERCPAHLAWIGRQKCCVPGCAGRPSEAHHLLRCPDMKARGLKAGDDWCVPLCVYHHRGNDSPHGMGDELKWAARHGINLIDIAVGYWERSARERGKTA